MSREKLANLIFKEELQTPEYYLNKYPERNLKEGARVVRYAPSPTGFQHIGGVYAALINERLAHQSEGIFYLRIEDTDQKREVEGAIEDTIATMHNFGMNFDEGMTGGTNFIQQDRESTKRTTNDRPREWFGKGCFTGYTKETGWNFKN